MSKDSQGSVRGKMKHPKPAASRWWGAEQTTQMSEGRMTVMPRFSRRWPAAPLFRLWNFVRSYFVTGRPRRAVVLSFRSDGLRAQAGAALASESFHGKKANGSVGCHGGPLTTPKEEGRG